MTSEINPEIINIQLNGEARTFELETTIDSLINQLSLQDKRLAIEINQEILPRSEFSSYIIKNQDAIEIVQAIGGG